MHAHQSSFTKCRYQSRALSASPSPPPIPPQPNFIQYKRSLPLSPFDDAGPAPASSSPPPPPPPSRCYQLVPIINQRSSQQSPKMQSFINPSYERRSFDRNNYENIRSIVKPTFVVKDPRRKPYYYNELNQSLDAELDGKNSNAKLNPTKLESTEHHLNDDENRQNSAIRKNSTTDYYGSGGSLDHIF